VKISTAFEQFRFSAKRIGGFIRHYGDISEEELWCETQIATPTTKLGVITDEIPGRMAI
jgi:hypothetical protein